MLRRLLCRFLREDHGQDLVEYTLLIALICMVTFGVMFSTGHSTAGAWSGANSSLRTAGTLASGGSAPVVSSTGGSGSGGSGDTGSGDGGGDHERR